MRLLIITQIVDKNDPILGFFHRWIEEFARNFEKITVICLGKGKYNLPENVKVLSLGKEEGKSKVEYLSRFYKYIWNERRNYDSVFVHMNQEYVLLGWKFWKLWGKKIYLWRNHAYGNVLTRLAVLISDKVFYTSPSSFTARFKKAVQMPVGVDTELFTNTGTSVKNNSILYLGRISPVKNVGLIVEIAKILQSRNIDFTLDIVGDPVNPEDFEYKRNLENLGVGTFISAVPNYKTPDIYASHEIYLNLTPSGSFDKTILEAAACGCVPFYHTQISNQFKGVLLPDLDPTRNSYRIEGWFNTSDNRKNEIRQELRNFVVANHSLHVLMEKLTKEI